MCIRDSGYLALDHSDPSLKFDVFPEWEEVLTQLQQDITEMCIRDRCTGDRIIIHENATRFNAREKIIFR